MSFSVFNSLNANSVYSKQQHTILSADVAAAPSNLNFISSDASSITFSFNPPKTSGSITGYTFLVNGQKKVGYGTPGSYTINGLSPGVQYNIKMVANINASIPSGSGTIIQNVLSNSSAELVQSTTSPPNPPTGLSVQSTTSSSITISFTPPTGTITSYLATATPGNKTGTSTGSPITISGLAPATSYTVTIQAINTQGTSVASTGLSITTNTLAAPTNLALQGMSSTSATITFTTVTDATSYLATASPGGLTGTSTGSPITISGLTSLTTYTITIQSVISGGSSLSSSSVSAKIPSMASYSSNGVGIGYIAISNNLQNVSGVSGTTLQVSNNNGSSWTQRVSTGGNGLAGIGMSDDGVYQTTPVNYGPYYRSTNSGASFSSNGANLYHHAVSVSYNGQYQTMSRYPNTVRVSSNYGASFSDQNFGSVTGWSQAFCSGNGQYQMASMDAGHIFISSNYGSTWTQGTTSSAGWQRLGMSGDGKYCSGHSSDGNCWKSSNYGSSGSWSVAFTGASGPILFSSTGQYQVVNLGGALYYSLDYGVTWPQILPSVGYGAYAITSNGSVAASSGTTVYAFTHP